MTKRNKSSVKGRKVEARERLGRVVRDKFEVELKPPVTAKNAIQKLFLSALANYDVIVFVAPAGCGKSYLTMSEVADWLKRGLYSKCVISRPAVGMGNTLGLLPGDLRAKYEPYLLPLVDVMYGRYGKGWYETSISTGLIEFAPLEYVRGRSFDCVVVLEEAQNCTPDDVYTMLTRVSSGGKLIMIGDPTQNDLKGQNGIDWLVEFVNRNTELQQHIKVITATSDDIVRSGLCKAVVKAKENEGSST